MLDELLVEAHGRRYLGHLWAEPGPPPLGHSPGLRWHFSRLGHFVAEFPAIPGETPDAVRARLLRILDRIALLDGVLRED